ncbi:UNVERIFIED_CONTAM: hypothetical protein GTU68_063829 [Idotea baltica]|nr:hypothetical protein [Idotea baltica]
MGRQLLSAVAETDKATIAAAIDAPGQPSIGIITCDNAAAVSAQFDTIIDFTAPAVTLALLDQLRGSGKRVVIGTTGFTAEQLEQLHAASQEMPIVFAANYSIGVTVALSLLRKAARALGDDYDVEISEAHHHHKVDAPSGTALAMGHAVADALDRDLDECAVYAREGITGARDPKSIGFATVRAGDIIGEHTVMYAGNGERLEITHKAHDRMTFARGAVRAAVWLSSQPAGIYDMTHVLGIAQD